MQRLCQAFRTHRWGYTFHAARGLLTPFGLLMVLQTHPTQHTKWEHAVPCNAEKSRM